MMDDFVGKKKATSSVWTYFAFIPRINGNPEDETMAAVICHLSKRSIAAKGGNMTNLFFSFKNKHPRQFAELKAKEQEQQPTSSKTPQQTLKESFTGTEV